jgi:hypothetical protein
MIDLDELEEWLNRDGGAERDATQVIQGPELAELIREARFARKAAAFLASHREDLLVYLTVTLGEASAALAEYRELLSAAKEGSGDG